MRSSSWLGRACALAVATTAVATPPSYAAAPELIPALQVDGRGLGHGVGMAQDGALAMGQAGASLQQILAQFYPGTSLGRGSGNVRVPVYAGNNVEVFLPEGGEFRGSNGTSFGFAAGTTALVSRDGQAIRVKPANTPPPTTTSTSTSTTAATAPPTTTTSTTTTIFPVGRERQAEPILPSTTTTSSTSTTTTAPPTNPGVVFTSSVTVVPNGNGRVGIVPRGRRYRGVVELTPLAGGVRFVNQVNVETYLRGMGEVRNPSWPAAGLQAQAVAARTYALRAMAVGGELCDTQRCQVYIGSDAEYAAMDKAVAATAGQVLMYGKSLASAVYSANGGGHSATREEGFGLAGPSSYPYLRAAPYLCPKPDVWSVTLRLADVAKRLRYPGTLTGVVVAQRGPSGRATRIVLQGDKGEASVTGLAFDAALGLKSTLFNLKTTMAASVADIKGESILQAPPEEAAALTTGRPPTAEVAPQRSTAPVAAATASRSVVPIGLAATALWALVAFAAYATRRRTRGNWAHYLS